MTIKKKSSSRTVKKIQKKKQDSSSEKTKIPKANKKEFNFDKAIPVIGIILVIIVMYNAFTVLSSNILADKKITEAIELARPGELEIISISFSGCDTCYDVNPVLLQIKNLDVNVTSEKIFSYDSAEAQSLITEYGITRLPTLIVTGEIDKSKSFQSSFNNYGEKIEEAMVVTKQVPPYYNVDEQRVVGLVSLTLLEDSSCEYCVSLNPIITSLKQVGIEITEEKTVDISSPEGQALVNKYDIEKAPALILDSEASYYEGFQETWLALGKIEENMFIQTNVNPPYMDIVSGEEKGVVHFTYLDDETCENCYDPGIHVNILSRFGISPASERTVDVNDDEGQQLIEKYNIKNIPTVILSEGVEEYPVLINVWSQVGNIDDDGSFVFVNLDAMGKVIYKDLEAGVLVNDPNQN